MAIICGQGQLLTQRNVCYISTCCSDVLRPSAERDTVAQSSNAPQYAHLLASSSAAAAADSLTCCSGLYPYSKAVQWLSRSVSRLPVQSMSQDDRRTASVPCQRRPTALRTHSASADTDLTVRSENRKLSLGKI